MNLLYFKGNNVLDSPTSPSQHQHSSVYYMHVTCCFSWGFLTSCFINILTPQSCFHKNTPHSDSHPTHPQSTYLQLPVSSYSTVSFRFFLYPTPRKALSVRSSVCHVFYPHLTCKHTNLINECAH